MLITVEATQVCLDKCRVYRMNPIYSFFSYHREGLLWTEHGAHTWDDLAFLLEE